MDEHVGKISTFRGITFTSLYSDSCDECVLNPTKTGYGCSVLKFALGECKANKRADKKNLIFKVVMEDPTIRDFDLCTPHKPPTKSERLISPIWIENMDKYDGARCIADPAGHVNIWLNPIDGINVGLINLVDGYLTDRALGYRFNYEYKREWVTKLPQLPWILECLNKASKNEVLVDIISSGIDSILDHEI